MQNDDSITEMLDRFNDVRGEKRRPAAIAKFPQIFFSLPRHGGMVSLG
jgi:hypothetical protein